MQLTSLVKALLLSATALAANTTQVDVVFNDITVLDGYVQALTANVRAYQGGLITEGPQLLGLIEVHLATRQGYYDATSLPRPLSEADGERLIQHVNQTLSIDNPIAVSTLESKEALFDAAGTTPAIAEALKVLLNDHLAFSEEVLQRLPADEVQQGNEVVDVITDALDNGIEVFSS